MQASLRSLIRNGVFGAFLVSGGASAWAGAVPVGAVAFSPLDAQAVPLLSDLMVLMLVALVAVLAYRALRAGAAGRPLASVVALGIMLAGGVLSGRLESVAQAVPVVVVGLTLPGGGTVNIVNSGVDVEVKNLLPKTVVIKSVVPISPKSVDTPGSSPECVAGTVLSPSGSCYVLFVP